MWDASRTGQKTVSDGQLSPLTMSGPVVFRGAATRAFPRTEVSSATCGMPSEQDQTLTTRAVSSRAVALFDCGVTGALSLIFLKNYWVSEDAYLNFRSVAQLLAGNGPIWNPHERVQVFTSPLWYLLHALSTWLVRDPYLAVLLLSCLCFGATLFWLRRCVGGGFGFALAGLLFIGSNAAFDYTSSGQENVLGYGLLLCALCMYLQLEQSPRALHGLFAAAGATLLCRHDLATLVAPWLLWAAWSQRTRIDRRRALELGALLAVPLGLWSMFSLFYYGSVFPNPAYAKLSAGFPRAVHVRYGLQYLGGLFQNDALSPLCVLAALGLLLWRRTAACLTLAAAIVLHTCYVVYVGGDYMQGRFVSFEVILACAVVARLSPALLEGSTRWVVPLVLLSFALSYTRTPLNTSFAQPKPAAVERRSFVMDARATLGAYTSLYSYLQSADTTQFPEHPLAIEGRKFARAAGQVTVVQAGGMFGWAAGTDKIIVEAHGIADPLLARLPASQFRGVGHYARYRPEGYIASLSSGKPQLEDAQLNQYYAKIALITQSRPLWTWTRLEAILRFNLGTYDSLLEPFVREKITGKQQWL